MFFFFSFTVVNLLYLVGGNYFVFFGEFICASAWEHMNYELTLNVLGTHLATHGPKAQQDQQIVVHFAIQPASKPATLCANLSMEEEDSDIPTTTNNPQPYTLTLCDPHAGDAFHCVLFGGKG